MVTLLQQLERELWILNHHLSWPAGCLGDCLDRRKRCCHCHWGDWCLINLYGPSYTQRLVLEWGSKVRAREKRTVIPGGERKPQGTLSSQWPHANGTRKFKEAEKLWHYLALWDYRPHPSHGMYLGRIAIMPYYHQILDTTSCKLHSGFRDKIWIRGLWWL